jgi:hypothetical protein
MALYLDGNVDRLDRRHHEPPIPLKKSPLYPRRQGATYHITCPFSEIGAAHFWEKLGQNGELEHIPIDV